ncbi:putative tRNA sulfurtransferase [Mycoplasmopsis agalactiae]|uniref:Probable tRNA sulfurtransferase n=1 Tax=Mycoplasmopsis agalactiae (strain NCTC 10123 / CIP 59.7 / PG2) TaxID=347257 RepID=THII_MYCAP|nr:tRNA uracil 4-sulfurtransferase ThiI [Mycoplasmopsis agalactiae]A5IXS0.1 RecName: Full=Probable tRNA sulfurtransferase; AltName: Full=Sulfur carrier protein ThiS sulfurtransferase; AltName: Full=Thiamine biosynthesis protein ThiI; AltName: Full=tRNA 4-thiouridine synthase [Mycoplasmopsis agalactiae PG2]QYR08403.1 tRNA 4-thiouridine(8) synthase ThiI [Mycoplasmopsis agalactiae]CAL58829.1 Thiamine biosynthesis protein thiI [Mycoplasmopsis agalactiae PG2]SBO45487.1 putative tRNA sulfurtransferas
MYEKILIRYGELTLKGKNRDSFIAQLARNIKLITGEYPETKYDRMFLTYSDANLEKLQYVFGITSYSPVIFCENNLEKITNSAIKLVNKDDKTFKISARRNNKKFELTSAEINQKVGASVLKHYPLIKVDVHNPECNINIEVRSDKTYLFSKTYEALGGLPVGISGSTLHLMSGGIDSPVAAFKLMKRGLKVSFLSFISPPQTDEKTIGKIKDLVSVLSKYQGKSHLYLANYSKLMNYISFTSNESYRINLMRRSFYRIASKFAKGKNIMTLSNGENLGQVASQTIESLSTIASASDLLILRPLIANDKVETINIAKQIKTYDISIEKAKETCELFAPKNPVTKPNLATALRLEEELTQLKDLEEELLANEIEHYTIE